MTTRHGTTSGYAAHQRRGEEPCEACRDAKREYDARWRAAPEAAQRSRLTAKAQSRAKIQLAAAHRDEFTALYREALLEVFAQHGLQPPPARGEKP